MRHLLTALLLAATCALPAYADELLGIGDPVPAISIPHFFQGEAVKSIPDDGVFVLEFWATWCGPCKLSMPHLRELAKKYDGKVKFIAISDEPIETVEGFLRKASGTEEMTWSQLMAFAVATDPDGAVQEKVLRAAGQKGIPCSFLVSGGKIQWIGHPMSLDEPLEKVVDGTWDIAAAKKALEAEREATVMLDNFRPLAQAAMASGNWDEAVAYLEDCSAKQPDNVQIAMTKWNVLLLYAQRTDKAYEFGRKLVDKVWDNAQLLNQIAWTVVDDEKVERRDLALAKKAAVRANELTKEQDGAIIDTLARVYYEDGKLDEAIRWQRKAVEHAEGEMKDQLSEQLRKYEKEQSEKGGKSSPM